MNDPLAPRRVEPLRCLAWFRLALEMMTRRLPLVLLVSVTVYVVVRSLTLLPLPAAAYVLGPALLLPAALAAGAHIYSQDWWGVAEPRSWALCLPALVRAAAVLLVAQLAVAAAQFLDNGGLDALRAGSGPIIRLLLPESLATMYLEGPQFAWTVRLVGEPFALAALATAFGFTECWFAPLMIRFASVPAPDARKLARRAFRLNPSPLSFTLLAVLIGARLVCSVPALAGLYVCLVAALAAVSFRDIFLQHDELETVRVAQPARSGP